MNPTQLFAFTIAFTILSIITGIIARKVFRNDEFLGVGMGMLCFFITITATIFWFNVLFLVCA